MRTRVKGVKTVGLGLKRLATFMVVATIMVSCGKNNTSGTTTDINSGVGAGTWGSYNNWGNYGNVGTQNRISVSSQVNVGGSGLYVGVTSEGDIAVIQNGTLQMHFCPRSDYANGQGQIIQQPVVNVANYCSVNEITNLDVALPGRYGTYKLAFRPYYAYGSQLCGGGYNTNQVPGNWMAMIQQENPCRAR